MADKSDKEMRFVRSGLDRLRRHWRSVFIFIAIITDALMIGVGGLLAYYVRDNYLHLGHIEPMDLFGVVVYSGTVFISFALVLGLYRATFHTRSIYHFVLAWKAFLFAAFFILASFYFLRWSALPRVFTALFFTFVPAFYVIGRIGLRRFNGAMQKRGFGLYRTLLVDQGRGGQHFFRRFDYLPELGYDVVALAAWNGAAFPNQMHDRIDFVHCRSVDDLKQVLAAKSIERVILPALELRSNVITDILGVCREVGAKLIVLSQESEELLRFSRVNDIAGLPLYSPARGRVDKAKRTVKRVFDLFGSVVMIVALLPVLLLASMAILIEDGRPILYKQRRALAKGRKEFNMFKFRTMVKNADSRQAELYERNQTTGGLFMLKEDPRLLKVGRILRKFSIDEMPQLFNVFKGDMSLVGPRPLSVLDLENITPDNRLGGYYEMRARAIPGMTGLWQISGRREVGFKEMVLLDLYYIENQSIMFDLEILFATIPVVLFGRGAY